MIRSGTVKWVIYRKSNDDDDDADSDDDDNNNKNNNNDNDNNLWKPQVRKTD